MPPTRHQPRGLRVVFEDDSLLVADKAPGLLTVSTANERDKTAYSLLTNYVRKGQARSRARVFIVHRLDRETSGLLVFAKTEAAKRSLQAGWEQVRKTYVAVVEGAPKEDQGVIQAYLAENSAHQVYVTPDAKRGQWSETGWKLLRRGGRFSLLELALKTGRKNQIRVHLAHLGHPVAGDRKYGAKLGGVKRLCLHAAGLAFRHPGSGQALEFKSPAPGSLLALV